MENEPSLPTTTQASSIPKMRKGEEVARAKIKSALPSLIKALKLLDSDDAVEANTRILVNKILVEALGYNQFEELTAEYMVHGDYADIGIRVDKQIEAFVEVKRIKQKLKPAHLRQVESYALKDGVDWAILTNGREWQVYHLKLQPHEECELTLIFTVDLLDEQTKPREMQEKLFYISKYALSKGKLSELWKTRDATSAQSLRNAIFSKTVLNGIRLEVRRNTKQNVEFEELRRSLETLFKS